MLHLGVLHPAHSAGLDEPAEVLVGDALPDALVPLGPAGAGVKEVAEDGAVLQPPSRLSLPRPPAPCPPRPPPPRPPAPQDPPRDPPEDWLAA